MFIVHCSLNSVQCTVAPFCSVNRRIDWIVQEIEDHLLSQLFHSFPHLIHSLPHLNLIGFRFATFNWSDSDQILATVVRIKLLSDGRNWSPWSDWIWTWFLFSTWRVGSETVEAQGKILFGERCDQSIVKTDVIEKLHWSILRLHIWTLILDH